MLTAIVTMTSTGGLGLKGQLPWKAVGIDPSVTKPDMDMFRQYTTGKTCLFGAETYKAMRSRSISDRTHLLDNRKTWVLGSREIPDIFSEDVQFKSMGVLNLALDEKDPNEEIMICGGLKIYEEFLPRIDKLIMNVFRFDCPHDVKWPWHPTRDLPNQGFDLVERTMIHPFLGSAVFYRKGTKVPW